VTAYAGENQKLGGFLSSPTIGLLFFSKKIAKGLKKSPNRQNFANLVTKLNPVLF